MTDNTFETELVRKLKEQASRRLSDDQAKSIDPFLERYYHRVPEEDLQDTELLDLYGAAVAHWDLARQRQPGQPTIHVYNPNFEEHGWQSTHTIVEIITDDLPFLVDSVSIALNQRGLTIHLTIHPVVRSFRNKKGHLEKVVPPHSEESGGLTESFMQFQVDRQTESATLQEIEQGVRGVLEDVRLAYVDWAAMREHTLQAIEQIERARTHYEEDDVDEAAAFCRWIEDNNFTFLGTVEFDRATSEDAVSLEAVKGSALGILRPAEQDNPEKLEILPTSSPGYLGVSDLLVVTKANARSTVHRAAYLDYIGIKRFNAAGEVDGEYCLVGLFTSAAYNGHTRDIPLLRSKTRRLLERSGLPVNGHAAKALQNIVENYPRDGLFQITDDELKETANGILALQERQRIRLFARRDRFGRFYSCLVYVPRERFNSDLRQRIQRILLDAYGGHSIEFNVQFSASVLARIHFVVDTDPDFTPELKTRDIEKLVAETARSWTDNLRETLVEQYGEEQGNRYFHQYGNSFPVGYQEDYSARRAAFDIRRMDETVVSQELGILFYRPLGVTDGSVRLKLFSTGTPIPLSEVLPMMENMGLRAISERPYRIQPADRDPLWIHEFTLITDQSNEIDADAIKPEFESAFARVWSGNVEDDGFNQLVVVAGLTWRDAVVLRAYYKFLRQIHIRFSQDYVIRTLAGNPRMASRLVRYFHARFNPDLSGDRENQVDEIRLELEGGMERVVNLDEDRILRGFLNAIDSTLRTNFFQATETGSPKEYVSLKFDPRRILWMPEPRPMFEIFVYSPRVEAVHLRGGKVARGGLRWSDRPEDFRTEVLGLVKAQMVKNAVIVPVGSKGGFVVKRMPEGDRDTRQREVIECYKTFIRGMLDITDNLKASDVLHPERVVRYDEDDPYLVVAADKGTATFSDIANSVSEEYGFWLGDAFASGGSSGYDHKKMGITAKGAWESVKRHFRELGTDIQSEPFSVVGIGDMAGDVFGNGMLLSTQIRLIGAFNHLHIFLDPDPDPESSFKERERLFNLPRSSWEDYNLEIVSKGGGVFPRSAKQIKLTAEAQHALGIKVERLTPNELIHAMLKAPVDLLWNGGIGTYVKSSTETHDQVRDRANDPVRVNGADLRCKVVGEGGNLGMTQLGRIEYSRDGGLCYTDSIDNSAGVDCSDHEVNIKILLNSVVEAGDMTVKQRNQLLAEMTSEVSRLVLRDNYGQTQAISLAASHSSALFQQHVRLMKSLERDGKLDRALEFLPDDETIIERANEGKGLVRPELSVLLSYSKLTLYQDLLNSDVPEDEFLSEDLLRYFPPVLSERFSGPMAQHRLRRELISTHITNSMVNRVGPTFAFRLWELTGKDYPHVARAYTAVRDIFSMRSLWSEIESLDNKVADAAQKKMIGDAVGLVERGTIWLLRNRPSPLVIADTVRYFKAGVEELGNSYPRVLAASNRLTQKRRVRQLLAAGVPPPVANRIAGLVAMSSAFDIVDVATISNQPVPLVATVYYEIGDLLNLHWLRDKIAELPVRNHWHSMAKFSLRNDLHKHQRDLVAEILSTSEGGRAKKRVKDWIQSSQDACGRFERLITDLRGSGAVDFAMLSVAVSEAQALVSTRAESSPIDA